MAELDLCPVHHCAPLGWYEDGQIHVQCIEESCRLPRASGGNFAEATENWNAECAKIRDTRPQEEPHDKRQNDR